MSQLSFINIQLPLFTLDYIDKFYSLFSFKFCYARSYRIFIRFEMAYLFIMPHLLFYINFILLLSVQM
jgi:hypothetical protein